MGTQLEALWNGLLEALFNLLQAFHNLVSPLFGEANAWGWAIILLTVAVRLALLPLAIKQTRSQRAMQRLAPEVKKIQAKYKADRGLMRSNPEKYRELRSKQQEATMALYKEHGVNPAAGCAPLLAQLPIFIALFNVLRSELPETASFYFVDNLTLSAPEMGGSGVDFIGAILLIGLMGVTTFLSSRQMTASSAVTPEQAQQQKIMMYVMPVVLIPLSWSIPAGVLLYWVTTNLWTLGQQYVMFRSGGSGSGNVGAPPTAAKAAK